MPDPVLEPSPSPLRALLTRLAMPTDDWAHNVEDKRLSMLTIIMGLLLLLLGLAAGLSVLIVIGQPRVQVTLTSLLLVLGIASILVCALMFHVRRYLLEPMAQIYAWALRMCDGDMAARIPPEQKGRFAKLTFHVNRLSEALEKLANEMDDLVSSQTHRLQQKNLSLEVLYEVTATISTADTLDQLLDRATNKLMTNLNAQRACIGLYDEFGFLQPTRLFDACAATENDEDSDDPSLLALPGTIEALAKTPFAQELGNGLILTVPLGHQLKLLGVVRLVFDRRPKSDEVELEKLLASVGQHLGMAITKDRLDEESRKLSLIEERTSLAYELHDSLAQTLASMRFQVKILDETLAGINDPAASQELTRINDHLDEAHTELRELIGNFRAPIDQRGLLPALAEVVEKFRRNSGITTHLQTDCDAVSMPLSKEIQVIRIVRESLSNAQKHSHANMIRVFLRRDGEHRFRLLVEDDGRGFSLGQGSPKGSEQLGLMIMHERAARIGGQLWIDSEVGEGTRVSLIFDSDDQSHQRDLHQHRLPAHV